MNKEIKIRGSLLARNTLLNLIGQGVPLVVAVVTMPFIIRGLGTERFGVLALAWVVIGYFGIFDLGLGRAATKFVAEAIGKGEQERIPVITWTAVTIQTVLGILGGFTLAGITPLLVECILNIPQDLRGEALSNFYILAVSIPVVLVSGSFRGVLGAAQRFDLVNAIRAPFSAVNFLLPLVGVLLDWELPRIVALLVISRILAMIVYYWSCTRIFPTLKGLPYFHWKELRILIGYGGWVTVSSVVGPALVYLDRFLIGSLLSMSAVAYYTAPYEVVARLRIIPGSLIMTLFPAFSTFDASGNQSGLEYAYSRSVKYLLLIMAPFVLVLALFAGNILRLWLGTDFAEKSTLVFQILAIGILVNSIAYIPFAFLQGRGRPDITAKFHLLEVPIYVGLAWFLIKAMGVSGAALAWTLRVGLDALLLFGASWKLYRMDLHVFVENGLLRSILVLLMLTGTLLATLPLKRTVLVQASVVILLIILFVLAAWRYVLDIADRKSFVSFLNQLLGMLRGAK